MATNQSTEIWSDLDQNLVSDGQGNLKKVINIESVKTSINNILGTSPGERCFLPQFAIPAKAYVFEPMNTRLFNKLADQFRTGIEQWEPRVIVEGLDIDSDPDNNKLTVTVRFQIQGYTQTFSTTTTITA